MKHLFISLSLAPLSLAWFIVSCSKPAAPSAPDVKSYDVRGIIRQIPPDRLTVNIQHDAISGYMAAMTMDFNVKNTNELNGLAPGDEITFKLKVGTNDSWIEGIRFESHRVENLTNNTYIFHASTAELQPGDLLPDGQLTDESGRVIHLADFRGQALAFTFFYSRCPLPDYCPRMMKNFSEARQLLLAPDDTATNWQFLSISFDPEFDQPERLANYARLYRGDDAGHWLFTVAPTNTLAMLAPSVDLMFMTEGPTISHNLRTVVLDPQGRIYQQFDGNRWTPQELAKAVRAAAKASAP